MTQTYKTLNDYFVAAEKYIATKEAENYPPAPPRWLVVRFLREMADFPEDMTYLENKETAETYSLMLNQIADIVNERKL